MNRFQRIKFYLSITLVFSSLSCYHSSSPTEGVYLMPLLLDRKISVLFVGDSLSERSGAFGLANRLGPDISLTDISRSGWDIPLWRSHLADIATNGADILIIGLGTNDANNYATDLFPQNYEEFHSSLKSLYPSGRIIHTLPPPTDSPILKTRIQINNSWIKSSYPQADIVDLFGLFESNKDLPLYPVIDLIHPNPIGYDLIGNEYAKIINSF